MERSGGLLNAKEAEKLFNSIDASARKAARNGVDFDGAALAEAMRLKNLAKTNAKRQKYLAYVNFNKNKQLNERLNKLVEQGLTPGEAFQAITVGTQANVASGRFSIDAQHKQLQSKYMGGMLADLEKGNLLEAFNTRSVDRLIARELWEIGAGKPGVTQSEEARKIAAIIHKYQANAKDRLNRAGADIGTVDGYITRQSHDTAKILTAGFEKWRDAILPKLDKRTFEGVEDIGQFMKSTFDALSSGIHLKPPGENSEKLLQFKGPANLAKKISKERSLHFKDADSWYDYNQDFGRGDMMDTIINSFDHSARNIALMENFGTNPQAMFDRLLQKQKEKYRTNPKALASLMKSSVKNQFDWVSGAMNIPESPKIAAVGGVIRAVKSMSSLGGVLITSMTDIPNSAAELRYQGNGYLDSYASSLKAIMAGRGSTERKQLASLIGVGFDGMSGAITGRFSSIDDVPGRMSKLMRMFFKLNGLTWWTDVNKLGVGMTMSHRLSQLKHLGLDGLDDDTKRIFNHFGITGGEWDLIRKTAVTMADGNEYLTADTIQNLDDAEIRGFLGDKNASDNRVKATKDAIETKLQSYFIDRVTHAVLEVGDRERSILLRGTKRGTIEGEVWRMMVQFKSFGATYITKTLGRALYAKGKADIPALIHLMIGTTAMGYLAMSAKDIVKGKEPRDPTDRKTWVASFLQGGGAGIYGDFLFGEHNRMGGGIVGTLAGPTAGSLEEVYQIFASLKDVDKFNKDSGKYGRDIGAKSLNAALNNTPFANLFYTRAAMNHLFIYRLQEEMNPGYLRRMERRVKKENNQEFFIKPSSVVR
jgi:hypothetical protein